MQEVLFDWLIFQVLGWNVESTSKVSSDNTVKIGAPQVGTGQVGLGVSVRASVLVGAGVSVTENFWMRLLPESAT